MKKLSAFTLIELLIVVAIIAILAAIAVPNFLEAQVRSKVSRARADMRTIATAIESYAVDYNKYAPFNVDPQPFTIPTSGNPNTTDPCLGPTSAGLTSPVAYLSSVPQDAFGPALPDDDFTFSGAVEVVDDYYYNTKDWFDCRGFGWRVFPNIRPGNPDLWVLQSKGPDQYFSNSSESGIPGADEIDEPYRYQYDATNGTVSAGNIVRSGP